MEGDRVEYLLSDAQLSVWNWILQEKGFFSRKDVVAALNMPQRTVEASIKKLMNLNKIERFGQGKATRYRVKLL